MEYVYEFIKGLVLFKAYIPFTFTLARKESHTFSMLASSCIAIQCACVIL